MTLTELKAWIAANVFTSNNRLNTGTSFREVLNKVADETFGKVETMIGATALKTPITATGTPKGLEIWGTGGAGFGLPNDFLEASIKTSYIGSPEMEFWDVFTGTRFSFKDGAGKTERFRITSGNAWLPGNLHVGVGADRNNYGSALFVNGGIRQGNTLGNKKISLWVDAENDHEYYGFGLNSAVLRYQVGTLGADHIFYAGNGALSSNELMRIRGNGNVIVGGSDNGLAKFQTPSISLGLNYWHYASDGTERLFYGSAITYHRVASGGVMIMMFGSGENYNLTHNVFGLNNDSFSDISQFALTGAPSAVSRQWVHRKEANGVDYRFFDWNGSTARDWWNVYASTQKMSLAQIIHANYGSNVGIGTITPDSSALLDLNSTTKALLLTRMTTTERNAIPVSAARKGLLIMNVTTNKLNFYNGSAWEAVTSA